MSADIDTTAAEGVSWEQGPVDATERWATRTKKNGEVANPCSRRGVLKLEPREGDESVEITMNLDPGKVRWLFLLSQSPDAIGYGRYFN